MCTPNSSNACSIISTSSKHQRNKYVREKPWPSGSLYSLFYAWCFSDLLAPVIVSSAEEIIYHRAAHASLIGLIFQPVACVTCALAFLDYTVVSYQYTSVRCSSPPPLPLLPRAQPITSLPHFSLMHTNNLFTTFLIFDIFFL